MDNSTNPYFFNQSSTTSTIITLRFMEDPSNVFIPIVMFIFGAASNILAIVNLLYYKYRGRSVFSISSGRKVTPVSRDCYHSDTDAGGMTHFTESRMNLRESVRPIRRSRSVKFGAFHSLVSVLAILDLLSTLCTSPLTITLYVKRVHIVIFGGKALCNYSAFAMLFFALATMAMVMAMSIERLFSIRFAFWYQRKASARKALVFAFGLFVLSTAVCAMPIFGFGNIRAMYPYSWCFANWNAKLSRDKVFNYLYVSLGLLMFGVTMTCNVVVIYGLVQMKKKIDSSRSARKKKAMSKETQMIIQLVTITTIFTICWLPIMFRILFNQLGVFPTREGDRIAIWLAAVNPILDPWVYIFCRFSLFRQVYQRAKSLRCTEQEQARFRTTSVYKKSPSPHDQPAPFN